MNEGVEWAAHCCLTLDWLGDDVPVSTARLAAGFELPPAYLNKQLQALTRADILTSVAGPKGGFRLARPLSAITMMDVVTAIEGPGEAFRCTEIRQRGPGAGTPARVLREPCAVAASMHAAELEWRRALMARSLADVRDAAQRHAPKVAEQVRAWYAAN